VTVFLIIPSSLSPRQRSVEQQVYLDEVSMVCLSCTTIMV